MRRFCLRTQFMLREAFLLAAHCPAVVRCRKARIHWQHLNALRSPLFSDLSFSDDLSIHELGLNELRCWLQQRLIYVK